MARHFSLKHLAVDRIELKHSKKLLYFHHIMACNVTTWKFWKFRAWIPAYLLV